MGAAPADLPIPSFGEPIPVPASSEPVLELVPFHAASVEPRLGGQLMTALAAVAPLNGLQHLKRIRKLAGSQPPVLHILLCPVDWQSQQQAEQDCGSEQAGEHEQQQDSQGSCQRPELPPGVAGIAEQHGLRPFNVQVRVMRGSATRGGCSRAACPLG